jgi:hypothetical protein
MSRYSQAEKIEIIRLVETSELSGLWKNWM